MSGSGGIGGNLETSVLFDVSGVRTGSEIYVNQMHIMEGATNRTSATLQAASARTADYSQSIDRAAEMVELLALKMLTLQANSERAGASAKKMASDFTSAASSGRSLTDMMNGGALAAQKAAEATERYNKNLELSRQNTGGKTGISLPGDGRSLTSAMMGGSLAHANQQEANVAAEQALRDREDRIQRAREMDIRAINEDKAFMDRASNEKVERLRRDAQIENDIEDQRLADMRARYQERIQAEARYERARIRHNYRIQQDANRFAAGARPAPEMRTAPNQINPRFFQMSRELQAWERARTSAQGMRDAIFQARVALDPMVGLEARLANEAGEFAENMARAVRQGHMTQAQADELLQTYQQLTAQQVLQARNQQQSFLGMRNFGFVAQQGAYAIEDFAQVFGTMGLAGGIRAAGNNLTAMAATMGPMVGVFGSLAAAAVMIGLHLWESRDAAEEVNDQLERMEDLTKRVNEYQEYRVGLIMQMNKLQSSGHQELMAMYDENLSKQQEIHAVELARLETNRQLAQVTNRKQELDEANRRAEEEASKQIGKLQSVAEAGLTSGGKILLGIGRDVGGALAEAFSGAGSLIQSKEGVKLTEEQFNAETKLQIEMNRQEAILKRLNDEERKRRDLIEAQSRILQEQSQKLTSGGGFFGQIMFDAASGEEAAKRRMTGRGEFDVNDPMGANYEYANQFRDGRAVVRIVQEEFSEEALAESYGVVKGIRERLQMQESNGNNSLEVRARMQAEIVKLNETLLGIEERRFALFEAGKRAAEEVRSGIIGQYEGLNEVFRFEQGILETRRKITEQIDLAVRANRVTEEQAESARQELETVIALEEDRFWAEKRIEDLQEREKGLRDQLQNNQAPTQLGGAVARGSAQALQILEQDRMTQLTKNENQPVVDELRRILREIQQQRDDLKAISITFPDAAALEGF